MNFIYLKGRHRRKRKRDLLPTGSLPLCPIHPRLDQCSNSWFMELTWAFVLQTICCSYQTAPHKYFKDDVTRWFRWRKYIGTTSFHLVDWNLTAPIAAQNTFFWAHGFPFHGKVAMCKNSSPICSFLFSKYVQLLQIPF